MGEQTAVKRNQTKDVNGEKKTRGTVNPKLETTTEYMQLSSGIQEMECKATRSYGWDYRRRVGFFLAGGHGSA
jgi:hypothetical protein